MKTTKNKQMSVNTALWILRISQFCRMFLPALAIIILIYTGKGVTVGDFFLIQGIFRLAAFLLEIPSGYLSDRFSRRHVLLFGAVLHVLGFVVIALAYGFWQIILGEALLGIASALFSGTLEAYTYDLLKRNKTQSHFLKEMGSVSTWGSAAGFIGTIIGPEIYKLTGGNGNLLIWISALFAGFQFILCLILPELTEVVRKKQKNKSAFMDVIGITYHTMKNAKLRTLILFPSLFAAFTVVIFWMLQPVMELSNVPVYLFGIYIGLNQFSRILASKYAYKVCNLLGEIKTSMLSILALVIGIVMSFIALHTSSMPVVYIAIGIMTLVPALHKLNDLQYNTLIHDDIDSKERGTVLSTRAMIATLFGSAMLSGTKYVYDAYGAEITMLILLFATVLLVALLRQVRKHICS
jgi:MFS family permease